MNQDMQGYGLCVVRAARADRTRYFDKLCGKISNRISKNRLACAACFFVAAISAYREEVKFMVIRGRKSNVR